LQYATSELKGYDMTEMTESDIRVHPRKHIRCPVKLSVDNKPPMEAWTFDISLGGISLIVPQAVDPGQFCVIKFDADVGGSIQSFSAIAKAVYSVSSASGEYRTGFQFHQLSAANSEFIHKLAA
jgi:c-di-GMP-binding flagellar brake protein YcgR